MGCRLQILYILQTAKLNTENQLAQDAFKFWLKLKILFTKGFVPAALVAAALFGFYVHTDF